jgi:N-acetylmuramic acid 6-phosphate etherase
MSATARPPDRPSAVLLGIDVGGSHTRGAVSRSDCIVLGRAEGPGAPMRTGQGARTAAVVADVVRRAAAAAGLSLPADALVVGAAGAGRAAEQEELAAAVIQTGIARTARAVADAEVALAAAFETGPGILLNAGTGTIAYARDPAGRLHRVGGYGWQMADEGGGYWLGRRALQLASQAYGGGGENSTLGARILAALGLSAFDDLVRWSATATPAQVAGLAPHLLEAAGDGEPVARRVVAEAAAELTSLVLALERHFPGTERVSVATTGSLLAPASTVAAALAEALKARAPRARLVDRPLDAPAAALKLAARLLEDGSA